MQNTENADVYISHVHGLLHWEKNLPNKKALVQPLANGEVISYTWMEVAQQVRCIATYLLSLNLPKGTSIAIYGKNSAHWIMADLAIWMAGHVSVPLYPTLNAEGATYVLEHSDAKVLFIGKLDGKTDSWNEVKDQIPAHLTCICLALAPEFDAPKWDDIVENTAPLDQVILPEPSQLATIIYTSGSTGLPKGVMQSFGTLLAGARELQTKYQVTEADRALSYLPLAHVAERIFIECTLMISGFTAYFANSIETFVEDLNRAQPTLFFSVPRLWTKFYLGINEKIPLHVQKILFKIPVLGKIVKKKLLTKLGLNKVRYAFTASAPLPTDIILWYRNLGLELLEVYGMTENCGYSHVTQEGNFAAGYVGNAQPKVECKIDENGEILVKSPGTMLGYYKNPEKTAEDMTQDGFLRTGDLGEIDASGRLKITGRIKDIFKTSKGKYIMPVPTEQKLGNHELIESVCVGGSSQPQPVAFIMLPEEIRHQLKENSKNNEIESSLKLLRNSINETLESHEKISFFVVVNEPWTMENDLLTPTLKIKRNKIESHYEPFLNQWATLKQEVVWES